MRSGTFYQYTNFANFTNYNTFCVNKVLSVAHIIILLPSDTRQFSPQPLTLCVITLTSELSHSLVQTVSASTSTTEDRPMERECSPTWYVHGTNKV